MNVVQRLVNEIMLKNQLLNPNQVANSIDMDRSHLGKLLDGKAKPNAKNYLRMAKKAGWSLDKALEELENKEKGNIDLSLLIVTALGATLGFKPFLDSLHCILCKIDRELNDIVRARITLFKVV